MNALVLALRDLANRQADVATQLRTAGRSSDMEAEADILMGEAARLEELARNIAAGTVK